MSDFWLREAVAALAEVLECEQEAGRPAARERMEAFREAYLGLLEAGENVPLAELEFAATAADRPATQIARAKGVWVLWMLRSRLGEPAFRELLKECAKGELEDGETQRQGDGVKAPAHRHARTPASAVAERCSFRQAVARYDGRWVDAFVDFWVCGIGLPEYRLVAARARPCEGGYEVTLKIENRGTGAYPSTAVVQTEEGARHPFSVSVPAGEAREVTYFTLTRPVTATIDPEGEILTAGPREGWRPVRVLRWWIF